MLMLLALLLMVGCDSWVRVLNPIPTDGKLGQGIWWISDLPDGWKPVGEGQRENKSLFCYHFLFT